MSDQNYVPNSPGEGYRFLQPGETIQSGDENQTWTWESVTRGRRDATWVGHDYIGVEVGRGLRFGNTYPFFYCRRRIT